MTKSHSSAVAAAGREPRAFQPSIMERACANFSFLGFWQESKTALLLVVLVALAVVVMFVWLARRRRKDAFPELTTRSAEEISAPEADLGMTQIESPTDSSELRSAPSPGLYGKIEVLVGNQQISSYLVSDNPLPVGRDPGQSLVVIPEPIVSKLHCQIFARSGQVYIRDLNSTNGVYVNNEKVGECALKDNDEVFLGKKGTVRIIYHR